MQHVLDNFGCPSSAESIRKVLTEKHQQFPLAPWFQEEKGSNRLSCLRLVITIPSSATPLLQYMILTILSLDVCSSQEVAAGGWCADPICIQGGRRNYLSEPKLYVLSPDGLIIDFAASSQT